MKTIKAGIIGTGFIGPAHVEAARRLGFVEMVALCEANDDLARAKAAALMIPKAYGSVDALRGDYICGVDFYKRFSSRFSRYFLTSFRKPSASEPS